MSLVMPNYFQIKKATSYIFKNLINQRFLNNVPEQIRTKKVIVENISKGIIISTLLDVSDNEAEIILSGGQLPFLKRKVYC